jgi:hypothetical protein
MKLDAQGSEAERFCPEVQNRLVFEVVKPARGSLALTAGSICSAAGTLRAHWDPSAPGSAREHIAESTS